MIKTGEELKALRERFSVTQDELAEALGIDKSLISKYENNHQDVSKRVSEGAPDALKSIAQKKLNETLAKANKISEALQPA